MLGPLNCEWKRCSQMYDVGVRDSKTAEDYFICSKHLQELYGKYPTACDNVKKHCRPKLKK